MAIIGIIHTFIFPNCSCCNYTNNVPFGNSKLDIYWYFFIKSINKYTQQILKVVASKYDFDTYKKSVDLKKVKINKKAIDGDSDDEILVKKQK